MIGATAGAIVFYRHLEVFNDRRYEQTFQRRAY